MYDVAPFVPSKRQDWDNGVPHDSRADFEAFRFARVLSPVGQDIIAAYARAAGAEAASEAATGTTNKESTP